MADETAEILERLARIERDLDLMRDGLALVGAKRCSRCKRFYPASDAAALFDDGTELICYGCIREWWPERSGTLELKDRETVEQKMVRWLVSHHDARVIHQASKLPDEQRVEFRFVADCDQCAGTGQMLGGHCRYCAGGGTMWVVIPKVED
jgi:hypothetical protein